MIIKNFGDSTRHKKLKYLRKANLFLVILVQEEEGDESGKGGGKGGRLQEGGDPQPAARVYRRAGGVVGQAESRTGRLAGRPKT